MVGQGKGTPLPRFLTGIMHLNIVYKLLRDPQTEAYRLQMKVVSTTCFYSVRTSDDTVVLLKGAAAVCYLSGL